MTKVVIELEVDMEAYRKEYGPGSEFWRKYKTKRVLTGERNQYGPTYHDVPMQASDYEWDKPNALGEFLVDIIAEGMYDWNNDGRSWVKLTVNGKQACSCGKLEGHKDWCKKIAGPESDEFWEGL